MFFELNSFIVLSTAISVGGATHQCPLEFPCYLFQWKWRVKKRRKTRSNNIKCLLLIHFRFCSRFHFHFRSVLRLIFVFSLVSFSILAQISRLWSERYQSQQWQFNIKRRNHIDAVRRDGSRGRWRTTNESPFRRKWIADYDDNEKQSFNCGNGGTKRKYYDTQLEHSSSARDPFIFIVSAPIHFAHHFFYSSSFSLFRSLEISETFTHWFVFDIFAVIDTFALAKENVNGVKKNT